MAIYYSCINEKNGWDGRLFFLIWFIHYFKSTSATDWMIDHEVCVSEKFKSGGTRSKGKALYLFVCTWYARYLYWLLSSLFLCQSTNEINWSQIANRFFRDQLAELIEPLSYVFQRTNQSIFFHFELRALCTHSYCLHPKARGTWLQAPKQNFQLRSWDEWIIPRKWMDTCGNQPFTIHPDWKNQIQHNDHR